MNEHDSLDPMGGYDVLQIMRQLRHEATIFFSTHILDDVQKICDHVAIINYGALIAQGAIEEVMSDGTGIASWYQSQKRYVTICLKRCRPLRV